MTQDLRQSEGWAKYLKSIGFEAEESAGQKVFIRKLPGMGAVIKIQRPSKALSQKAIDQLAKKHRALFVKLEPLEDSKSKLEEFTLDPNPNLPTKTILIDLTRSEEQLWEDLSKDARQSVRKTQAGKMEIKSWRFGDKGFDEALVRFSEMLEQTGKRKGFWASPLKDLQLKSRALGKDTLLFLVFAPNHEPAAGALIFISGDTAFFHHISSTVDGQKIFSPYFLIWEVIKNLKAAKNPAKKLDLEGIHDPRYPKLTRKWLKFTIFKRKWGGYEVEYPRPLIKHYHPVTKAVFGLAQALDRVLIRA